MSLEDLPAAGQGDVCEHLVGAQVLHDGEEAVVVVVPFQQELFLVVGIHPVQDVLGIIFWTLFGKVDEEKMRTTQM